MNIYLFGVVGKDFTAEGIAEKIKGQEKVTVYIDSPGGYTEQGFSLYEELSKVPDLTTVAVGRVYSAAMLPFLAANNRIAEPNSRFLIHSNSIQPDRLTATDAVEYAQMLLQLDSLLLDFVSDRTGMEPERMAKMMGKDTFLTASMALEANIATKINSEKIVNEFKMSKLSDTLKSIRQQLGIEKKPVNMLIGLQGGGSVYVYTEDEELEGKQVVLANENGEPTDTPAPDGEHTLENGTRITVQNGVITTVAEVAEDKMDEEPESGYKEKEEDEGMNVQEIANMLKDVSEKFKALENRYDGLEKNHKETLAENAKLSKELEAINAKHKEYEELADVVAQVASKIESTYTPKPRAVVLNQRANKDTVNGTEPGRVKVIRRK